MLCAVLTCASVFAGDFEVTSGKKTWKSALKKRTTMTLTIDWSKCEYDEDMPVEEKWEDDYDEIVDYCLEKFTEKFNDKTKRLKIDEESNEAAYKMTIKMTNVDSFFSVMDIRMPGYKARISGSVKVVEIETGETVLQAEFDELKGGRDFVHNECYGKAFEDLAKELADF